MHHVRAVHTDVRVARVGRALLADHGRALEPPAPIQYLSDGYDRCRGLGRRRAHARSKRWGLVPGWWKKSLKEMRVATFNARSDTIADKPMFRDSFKRRRCLIPASGYYEWVTTPEGKQPYYFSRRDGQVITIAGVQDGWTEPQNGERLRSCSMVITEANEFVSDIHDRMPVILEAEHFEQWMNGNANDAAALMRPASDELLQKWPVSRRVNSSRADDSDGTLIEKIEVPT